MNQTGNRRGILGLAFLVVGVLFLGAEVVAQGSPQSSGQPARAVRLSFVDGQVKLSQGNQVLADQAAANTPLFEGAELTTADNGKAEIQFEDGSVARLAPDSSLTLQVLRGAGASADAEMVLNAGLAYFEFQGGGQAGKMSVRFGPTVANASGFTVLRVTMDTPPGSVAVFSGNVHLETGAVGGASPVAVDLHGGESVALSATDPNQYVLAESIEPNSWDTWNSDRDEALTAEAAAQTAAPADLGQNQNPAWNDLDANGSWYDVPGQGYVWSPYDAASADFDPYGVGSWMYTPAYGYVWASGYPWGYMPFQCGAWNFYAGFGWGWTPGMGGCVPWWGAGFYGGPNIGIAPIGYRPIPRPLPPHGPIGHRPIPMVVVHRHMTFAGSDFPARDKSAPVSIAGNSVQAMRPLPSRPVYSHEGLAAEGIHPARGVNGAGASGFTGNPRSDYTNSHPVGEVTAPGYIPRPAPASHPPAPSYTPPRSPSNSGGVSHPSGPGGGGGASHSSGGGGGGSHGGGSGGHR